MSEKIIHALAPLPGGNQNYVITLQEMLGWLQQHREPSRATFADWVTTYYRTRLTSVSNYYQTLLKIGVIHRTRNGPIRLTPLGIAIYDAVGEHKAELILDQLMVRYSAFLDTLGIFIKRAELLTLDEIIRTLQDSYPQWQSVSQFQERVHWLLSLGCLEKIEGRRAYQATAFGRAIYYSYTVQSTEPDPADHPEPEHEPTTDSVSEVIHQLEAASVDSESPQRFEHVLARVFQFLGFQVQQFGDSGHTDLLANARLGPESYSIIVDAKSRKKGRLQAFEAYTLKEHLENHNANYVVVIAAEFASGKVIRQAEFTNITLMPVHFVSSWIQLHATTPLNLQHYRAMFMTSGLLTEFPSQVIAAAEKQKRATQLIITIIDFIQEAYRHNLNLAWSADQLYSSLAVQLRDIRYTKTEVEEAIAFLAHPTIQAVTVNQQGAMTIGMDRLILASRLCNLANAIKHGTYDQE